MAAQICANARLDVGDRRAADLDAGVAPGVDAALGIALPDLADAEAGHEGDACRPR